MKAYEQRQKEPKIEVRIKPRTKENPSEDFKLVVKYEIELSKSEQRQIDKMVPQSPNTFKKNGYYQLPEEESYSEIEEEKSGDSKDSSKSHTINLNKDFDQILQLQFLVEE
jgi:hypothetical protein